MAQQSCKPEPMKIIVFSVDGAGHVNATAGMGQALARRGHEVKFLINEAFKNNYSKFGFTEIILKRSKLSEKASTDSNATEAPKNPIKVMAEGLIKSGFLSDKSPIEKLRSQSGAPSIFNEIYDTLVDFNPQLASAIEQEKPDLIILDHFLLPPAIAESRIPWIFLFSGNPIGMYRSDKLPPFGCGFAVDSDPATWQEYKQLFRNRCDDIFTNYQIKLNDKFGYTPTDEELELLKDPHMFLQSDFLNIYGYPAELDYNDIVPRPEQLIQVDAFCRESPEQFQLPEEFLKREVPGGYSGKLIYVSLGSMGSIDVDLMKRITLVLAKMPHKFIVSKGPRASEYDLPANCWGEAFLPQTKILPLVDLVITHGGNNTVTETFCFGKPQLVLPLFADQYDNAQRLCEKGFGAQLRPYSFTDQEMIETIDRLLADEAMHARSRAAAERIATSNSKDRACEAIEAALAKKLKQK